MFIKLWKPLRFLLENKHQKRCFLLCTTGENEEYFNNGLLVTIKSLNLTNPNIPIVIFYSGLSENQKLQLSGCKLVEIKEEEECYELGQRLEQTKATYYRFHLDKLREFDKVLYIDSDMVILDSLDEIFNLPGYLVAVGQVTDFSKEFEDYQTVFNLEGITKSQIPAFNAGFLCFDRKYWQNSLLEEVAKVGKLYGWNNLKNIDQTILNLLCYRRGGFTSVTRHYNFFAWQECDQVTRNSKGFLAPYAEGNFAKVLHFSGPFKPWLYETHCQLYPRLKQYMDVYLPCYEQFRKVVQEKYGQTSNPN